MYKGRSSPQPRALMPDSPTPLVDCEHWLTSACAGEHFYKKHEGKRYCVLHFPDKEKTVEFRQALRKKRDNQDFNFQHVWFPDRVIFSRFGVKVDFSYATFNALVDFGGADFHEAGFFHTTFRSEAFFTHATFKGKALFASAIFGEEAYFDGATFQAEADFRYSTFKAAAYFRDGATFQAEVDFRYSTFKGEACFRDGVTFDATADFRNSTFTAEANFFHTTFSSEALFTDAAFSRRANFVEAAFGAKADFTFATFSGEANFELTTFSGEANFSRAAFEGNLEFMKIIILATTSMEFQFARIDKSDHVSFHGVWLRPLWFVNVDAHKFNFFDVGWHWDIENEEIESLESKINSLTSKDTSSPLRLLAIAYRHLAVNAEDNHRYEEASKFRYMAMEAHRLEQRRGFAFWRLSWWYWLASGYGERSLRAFAVLIGIWCVAGLLYTGVGFARWEPRIANEADAATAKRDDAGAPLPLKRALTYSLGVMTLQRPEPKPATTAAHTLVLFETILGPVQAALLALAIRRKFMR